MKLYPTVKAFSESAPELFNAFKGYFETVRGTASEGVKKFSLGDQGELVNKLFAQELERRCGFGVDKFDGSVARYAESPVVKSFADAIIGYMIDMVLPETLIGSIGLIADIKFAGFGDALKFDIKNNGLFKVSKAGRRQKSTPAQKQGMTTETIIPENHQVTVYLSLPDILAGRQSLAEYIMKVVRSIETEMLYDVYDAFVAAADDTNLPSGLKETAFDEEKLISLCQKVTAYNQGKKAVIVGTAVALKSVLPKATSARILLEDEYVTMGYIAKFNNYDVIVLDQVADWTTDNYGLKLKDDRIFVLSPAADKLIKVGVEGESMSRTDGVYDNANLAVEGTVSKAWGVKCVTNAVAGLMQV